LPDALKVPLLDELAPNGFSYGGHYIVEFDPDSLWYETSLTMAALALKQGMKTEYHVFQHFPSEAMEALTRLGVDVKKLEEEELLSIWDSYTETVTYEAEKKEKEGGDAESLNLWVSTREKPLDVVASGARWAEQARAGYTQQDKRWLHLDDNTAIFLQYNGEEEFVNAWRTGALPFGIRARETPHFLGFVKGAASEPFYTKFEALCDGIIDVKAREEGGRIENYIRIRMLRGKTFDSSWHRLLLGSDGQVSLVGASSQAEQRRLAAIVFTDIVGYTALTQSDERLAMQLLEKHRELIRPILLKHSGREVKTMGDAFLFEFGSALEATECAVEMQQALHSYNEGVTDKVLVRVGVHLGDIIHREGDVYGDAVNIASRIEPLAPGGGICISQQVYDQVKNKVSYSFDRLETPHLKNVKDPIEVYQVLLPWGDVNPISSIQLDKRRIAVLPFANMSPDPNDGYFADGLTEELISVFSEVHGLRVIARTSVKRFRDSSKSARQIANELGVSYLLEGSVRKAGNRIRVTAHLVDAETQEEVWSERYEKDFVDVFSIQSGIATRVVDSLKVRLLSTERARIQTRGTDDIAAYVAYLKGRSLLEEGTEEAAQSAKEQFELAVKEDATYAKAYAGMADSVMELGDYLFAPVPVALEEATSYVKKAIALDPNLAEARVSLANIFMYDCRFEEARKEFERAIETNPSYSTGHHWYSNCLQAFGRNDEALEEVLKAEELDPLSLAITLSVIYRLRGFDMHQEIEKRIRKLEEIDAESPLVEEAKMVYAFLRKDWESATAHLRKMIERDPSDPYLDADLGYIYAVTNRAEEASKTIERLKKVPEDARLKGQLIAFVFVGLGNFDAAFEWLNYALSKKEFFVSWFRTHPLFESLRADPRFDDLLRTANLPPQYSALP
jgi:adenylate cyclase